jgi:integrase/recombinase XerC
MHQEGFLRYIELEKRYSPHTVTAYKQDLSDFFAYIDKSYGSLGPADIQHGMIRSWMVELMESNMVARSINRKLTTLRSFYKYMLRQGLVMNNPMLRVQPPKNAKKLPVFVEADKMQKLFDEIPFGSGFEGVRDRLIMELFYATGMRLSELIGLKLEEVDCSSRILKVLGKRNKERLIPFPAILVEQIEQYLNLRSRLELVDADLLLLTLSGKKMYPKMVYNIVVHYLSLVTTLDKKSPHVLRHTFATHMLNNGADINAIKELLGHANLSATQVYTHNTIEKLKNIHKQAHPKA